MKDNNKKGESGLAESKETIAANNFTRKFLVAVKVFLSLIFLLSLFFVYQSGERMKKLAVQLAAEERQKTCSICHYELVAGEIKPFDQSVEVAKKTEERIVADKLADAIIGRGKGIEHVFIKQLVAQPAKFGYKGNGADEGAIKGWAVKKAHLIAKDAGYIKAGKEKRVKGKGGDVAYALQIKEGGGITVAKYMKAADGRFKKADNGQFEYTFAPCS